MECSAYRQTNVENVFDEAFKLGIAAHKDAQKTVQLSDGTYYYDYYDYKTTAIFVKCLSVLFKYK